LLFQPCSKRLPAGNPDPWCYDDGEASSEFLFGFMRGGIHFGWPSGHLCTNTAVISSLICFYNKSTPIKIAGSIYLGYLFYGVIAHDNNTMHWFSDAVAGLLMGYAIGSTIGRNFRDEWTKKENSAVYPQLKSFNLFDLDIAGKNNEVIITPILSQNYKGMNMRLSF
jgi:hypothetical protein